VSKQEGEHQGGGDHPDIEALLDDDAAVERALAEGVRAALLRHKRAGVPIVVWERGRVKWIPASEIVVDETVMDTHLGTMLYEEC